MGEKVDVARTFKTLFLIAFVDLVGVGIVIPILPIIFLGDSFFASDVALHVRHLFLGFLIAAYPFAQFFGSPILGRLSDKYGRKPVLLTSLFGTVVGYVMFAVGLLTMNIFLLFGGRLLDGFTGGNVSVVMSSIADVSKAEEKSKNFGLIGVAFGLGFILGPFIGGVLADSSLVSWFSLSTPFFFAAAIVTLNLLLVVFWYKETIRDKVHKKVTFFEGFANIRKALSFPSLRTLFIVIFLVDFGWAFYTQFFQVFMFEKFAYKESQIGLLFAYIGLWIAITQGVIIRRVAKMAQPEKILTVSIIATALVVLGIVLIPHPVHLFWIVPFLAIFFGLTHPNFSMLLSNSVGEHSQGEILGIRQSAMALSQTIPPIIAIFALHYGASMPLVFSGVTIIIAWLGFNLFYKKVEKRVEF